LFSNELAAATWIADSLLFTKANNNPASLVVKEFITFFIFPISNIVYSLYLATLVISVWFINLDINEQVNLFINIGKIGSV